MNIIKSPSPNFGERNGFKPEIIVTHCTDGTYPGDLQWLTSIQSQVSSHYLVAPDGKIHQLVSEDKAAWHAGLIINPTFQGLKPGINPNLYSIGIEVSLIPMAIMTEPQKKSYYELMKDISIHWNIPIDRQHDIGHKEIRSNKTCPGTINLDTVVKDLTVVSPSPIDKNSIKKQIVELLDKL